MCRETAAVKAVMNRHGMNITSNRQDAPRCAWWVSLLLGFHGNQVHAAFGALAGLIHYYA